MSIDDLVNLMCNEQFTETEILSAFNRLQTLIETMKTKKIQSIAIEDIHPVLVRSFLIERQPSIKIDLARYQLVLED